MNAFTKRRTTHRERSKPDEHARRATPTSSSSAPGPPARRPRTTSRRPALDVLLLEKTAFPREKVCGDGLTPRAVRAARPHGHRHAPRTGWIRNKGLRIIGGGMRLELPWPELAELPRLRAGPHADRLRRDARPARARRPARGCTSAPTSPGRCSTSAPAASSGVSQTARRRRRDRPAPQSPTARRWSSPPTATPPGCRLAMGLHKRDDRPMGVAVRTYYTHARATTTTGWSPGSSCGTASAATTCCPATAGSSASATAPATSASASSTPSTAFGRRRLQGPAPPLGGASMPEEWGFTEENQIGADPRRRAADGLQPPAALHPRPAAGRRRRRHGQPVQRRGHRLRDGGRRARRRGHRAGAWAHATGAGRERVAAAPTRAR